MEQPDGLPARLARLETSNRWLRVLAAAALVIALAGPIWLFERFKGRLYSDNLYTPSLVLIDPNGGMAALQLDKERQGSQLQLGQIGSNANVSVRAYGDGARSLVFVDAKARKRAFFGIDATGAPQLELFDEKGKTIWAASAAK